MAAAPLKLMRADITSSLGQQFSGTCSHSLLQVEAQLAKKGGSGGSTHRGQGRSSGSAAATAFQLTTREQVN